MRTNVQTADMLNLGPEQLAARTELELLEFVRSYPSPLANPTEITHDHRRFLDRDELIRLARLVQLQARR